MIICKAPLRISIGGGGTALPAYYEGVGTIFSSLAINKYVSVCLTKRFSDDLFLRYSENEIVKDVKKIKHDIIRTILIKYGVSRGIEIASFGDVPGGTGLGSSGAFTVALCSAVKTYLNLKFDQHSVSELATKIEMIDLKRPIGLQDQYAASFGGFSEFTVSGSGKVKVRSHRLSSIARRAIKDNLLLFNVGSIRDATKILISDQSKMAKGKASRENNQFDSIVDMGIAMSEALSEGDVEAYGDLLHQYWLIKSERQSALTANVVHEVYQLGRSNGAIGGKLVGAGGSGFILFATKQPEKLRKTMLKNGIKELTFDLCERGLHQVSI